MKRQDVAFLQRVPLVAGLTFFAWSIHGETLMWDPNPESNIAGYRVYYGEASASPAVIDVGNVTSRQFSNLEPGRSYFFYVTAYNTEGVESEPSETITYTKASSGTNQPPSVQLASPPNGATFTAPATITINANAMDPDGMVTRVNFYSNGAMIGSDTTSPFTFTMNNVDPGNYQLSARAIDNAPSMSASAIVNVTVVASAPPEISSIPNQTIQEDSAGVTVNFMVRDSDTRAGDLSLSALSSNTELIPNGALTFGGSDSNRTLAFRPQADRFGTSRISVRVSDGQSSDSTSFDVLVAAVNDVPLVSDVSDQNIRINETTGPLPVTISDKETSSGALVLTAQSSNTQLVPHSGLTLGGSGGNRTITVKPASHRSGEAVITLTVSDGQQTRSSAFRVTVSGYRVAGTWLNIPLANQTGECILEFDATPLSGALDSQIGLSDGPATDFASLATAVWFGPSGSIQARNGFTWGARSFVPYRANVQYHFRMEISLATRLYSIYVTPQGGSEIEIGWNYLLRTEQSFVRQLNNFAGRTVSGGSLIVDGISIRGAAGEQSLQQFTSLADAEGASTGAISQDLALNTAATAPQKRSWEDATWVSTSAGSQSYQEVNGATTLNLSFVISWEQLVDPHTIVDFSNADGEASGFLWYSGGQLRVTHGTASEGAPLLLDPQAQYNVWVDWESGSGADGRTALYLSETGIKPATPLVSLEDGTGGAVERIYFGGAAPDSPPIVFEDIEVSSNGSGAIGLATN